MTAGTGARTRATAAPEPAPARPRRPVATGLRIALALLLPWVLLETGLRIGGYAPPDLRPRVALFPRFPAFYEPSRELGWVLKPNLDWRGTEVAIPFRTDASGNRVHGDANVPGAPTVDCIGDSSTFGFGVPDGATYPARLEATLRAATGDPSLRVRNLGVPGYTAYEARILAEGGGPHAPVTLVMMGFNDHFPATRTRFTSLWMRRAGYACFRSRACALIFDRVSRPVEGAPAPPPEIASSYVPDVSPGEYTDQLVRTVRALRAAGSEPILLVYPSIALSDGLREQIADFWKQPLDQVDANLAAHVEYQQLTREVAAREGVRVVDLPPAFDAADNVRLHLDWVHPNAEGQALIASTVADPVRAALGSAAAPTFVIGPMSALPGVTFRWLLLVLVVIAVTMVLRAPAPSLACRTDLGACAQPGRPRCGIQLGDWRVARWRDSGLAPDASHSACVREPDPPPGGSVRGTPLVSVVPQEAGLPGDTLLSRPAGSADAQRARVLLHVAGSVPDHWAFAVAGTFLDHDTPHACAGLAVAPPVNAGYAVIGGNWLGRPHGFYFERLADACVYDGQSAACPGEPSWIAHEFTAGETFALDLTLQRTGDAWSLEAIVAAVEPARPATSERATTRELGRMRQRVAEPCWRAAGTAGSALVVVIPDQGSARPESRVDVSGFAWARADRPAS